MILIKKKKEVIMNSKLYFFYTIGCAWCTKSLNIVDELNEEGYNILKLDLDEQENSDAKNELQNKFNIKCGTPFFINIESGQYICGHREKDILLKWINGVPVPDLPTPTAPMPRIPFYNAPKDVVGKWAKEYKKWKDNNSHLPGLRSVEEILNSPRFTSNPPAFPGLRASADSIKKWREYYSEWREKNSHLKNIITADQYINKLVRQGNVKNINIENRIKNIEKKLDKLIKHLNIK